MRFYCCIFPSFFFIFFFSISFEQYSKYIIIESSLYYFFLLLLLWFNLRKGFFWDIAKCTYIQCVETFSSKCLSNFNTPVFKR